MALQLNVKIEASPGMEYVFKARPKSRTLYPPHQSLPTVYFPVLWFQSTASLPETMAGPLLVLVNLPTILVMAASCCIVLGLLGMAVIYHRVRKTRWLEKSFSIIHPVCSGWLPLPMQLLCLPAGARLRSVLARKDIYKLISSQSQKPCDLFQNHYIF